MRENNSEMTEELRFTADAALIDRLGRELVGKQETALIELIKNSYDADATEVRVTFDARRILISDNGTGMSREQLIYGFLRLASDSKVREPFSRKFNRRRAGRKGIGRFATQRLGSYLRLRTWFGDKQPGLELTINWRSFEQGHALQDIPVLLDEIDARAPGTELEITHLRDDWSEAQIRRSWRGVLSLQKPFTIAPIENRPKEDPGFEVSFWEVSGAFSDPQLVSDYETEILSHAHAKIEFRVDETGKAEWRLTENKYGSNVPWTRFHHLQEGSAGSRHYDALRNAWLKAYYFNLAAGDFPPTVFSRIRQALTSDGGIRLYRNGFRVVPYGEPGDDWLRLDEAYVRRAVLIPISNKNFFGAVEVYDPEGERFEEHTSREGLIETPAFSELRELTSSVLTTAAIKLGSDRGRKTRAGRPSNPLPQEQVVSELRLIARRAVESAGGSEARLSGAQAASLQAVAELADQGADAIERGTSELADESTLLRMLATLGLTAAEFSHETGMTFEAVRLDLAAVFEAALAARTDDEFGSQSTRARTMLDRLDALTSYLNDIASARSARELAPISLSRAVEDFAKGIGPLAAKSEITLELDTPEFDGLFTKPMHQAELASILLNFYSNSVKAMRRTAHGRRIRIEAKRDHDRVVLNFSDTGDGIAEDAKARVFDLFFTTRAAAPSSAPDKQLATGTGLGLWIVAQIVRNAGGTVTVADAPPGFSTCLTVALPAEGK